MGRRVRTVDANNESEMVRETGNRANAGLGKFTRMAVEREMDAVSV